MNVCAGKFYAVHAVLSHSDEWEVVGVFTNYPDAVRFIEDMREFVKCPAVAEPQHLEMRVILDLMVKDRLRELAEPICALAAHMERNAKQLSLSTGIDER